MGERNSSSLKKEETMHPNKTLEKNLVLIKQRKTNITNNFSFFRVHN